MSSGMATNMRPKLSLMIPKPDPSLGCPIDITDQAKEKAVHERMRTMCIAALAIHAVEEHKKRFAKKKAEADAILESWKASKEKDQALITEITNEAAPRDYMRLAQLEEERKQKKEGEAELARLAKEVNKARRKSAREWEKMNKSFRKDMRERNHLYNALTPLAPSRRSARLAAKRK